MNLRLTKILLSAAIIGIFILTAVSAEESITDGRIKLTLHETSGRYSLYYLTDLDKNVYTSLFIDKDPRTTLLTVLEGNRVHRMGEAGAFTQNFTIDRDKKQAAFIWQSPTLTVTETFTIVKSTGSALSDGLKIEITLKNTSEQQSSVGIQYMFDTYLGERQNAHFTASDGTQITGEHEYTSGLPEYWLSGNTSGHALQFMLKGEKLTIPDRVIFANWKRLNNSSWAFDFNGSRNFNLLPYSINDSAVSVYYNSRTLNPSSTRTVIIYQGFFTNSVFGSQGSTGNLGELSDIYSQSLDSDNGSASITTNIKSDLMTSRELLDQINKLIAEGDDVSEEELSVIREVIKRLEDRLKNYE